MITKLALYSFAILSSLLAGCSSSDSPFTEGGISSGTNIVSEKNFTISFDEINPKVIDSTGSAISKDVEVVVTISAADKLNLTTTGATAYLDVDWGTLSAQSCIIKNDGSCSITWTSNANTNQPFFPTIIPGSPPSAFITFTSWIIGEESFTDLNGDALFGDTDIFLNDTSGPFLDLDFSGDFSTGDKVLSPGNNANGTLLAADGLFNGANCIHSTLCSPTIQIYLSARKILNIVDQGATTTP